MDGSTSTLARRAAEAARAFQQERTGHAPRAVTVMLSGETLVVTLHGALSPAEQSAAATPEGAARLREYHRELFAASCERLREEIERITRVAVREAAAEVEPASGAVVQVFTAGTMVQVFLLAHDVPAGSWSDGGRRRAAPGSTGDGDGETGRVGSDQVPRQVSPARDGDGDAGRDGSDRGPRQPSPGA